MRGLAFLFTFSVLLGVLLSALAGVVRLGVFGILAIPVGIVVGCLMFPVVWYCLYRKPLWTSVLIVTCTGIPVTIHASIELPLPVDVMQFAIGALVLVCVGIKIFISDSLGHAEAPNGRCSCGYNLTGNVSGRCPECGTKTDRSLAYVQGEAGPNEKRELSSIRSLLVSALLVLVIIVLSSSIIQWRRACLFPSDPEILIERLANGEALIHEAALDKLVEIGRDPLVRALRNNDVGIRRRAARGLYRLSDPNTVPALRQALEDNDSWVRMWARRALDKISHESAVTTPAPID